MLCSFCSHCTCEQAGGYNFQVNYATGSVVGLVSYDTVRVGAPPVNITNQAVGLASSLTNDFLSTSCDGLWVRVWSLTGNAVWTWQPEPACRPPAHSQRFAAVQQGPHWQLCTLLLLLLLLLLHEGQRPASATSLGFIRTPQVCDHGLAGLTQLHVQGLGFPALSQMRQTPPFYTALGEDKLAHASFSIWLRPNPEVLEAGELMLGGVNARRYSGNLTYLNVTSLTCATC